MSRTTADARALEGADPEREVALWLVEVGRRGRPVPLPEIDAPAPCRAAWPALHRLVLVGTLAAAIFQYAYLDALLQVSSLRSLVVFVLVGGHS